MQNETEFARKTVIEQAKCCSKARPTADPSVPGLRGDDLTTEGSMPALEAKAELELILMIVSDDPVSTVKRVSGLTSIAGYRLIAGPAKTLHDIYVDTPDRLLGHKRINLRVRGAEGRYWITMKVSRRLLSRKRHEREETEVPWSESSLNHVLSELAKRGVQLKSSSIDDQLSPTENLKRIGLEILQDRETYREPRDLVHMDGTGDVLAEVAVDSVVYHLPGQDVRIFEVEVEAKSQKGRAIIERVTRELQGAFGAELRIWRFGKLVTGKKIERLLKAGSIQRFLHGSALKPEAFCIIEKA